QLDYSESDEEPKKKKRRRTTKKGDLDQRESSGDVQDSISALTHLVQDLVKEVHGMKNGKQDGSIPSIDDEVASAVALKNFNSTSNMKQYAFNTKILIQLGKVPGENEFLESAKKDLRVRNQLLRVCDKNPRVWSLVDAQESTRELASYSKDLSKEVREYLVNEESNRKRRFHGAGPINARGSSGSSYGYSRFNQSRIPSLMETPIQRPPTMSRGVCFLCQNPGH
uniref:Uncharacterized protein n=1 Tax=Panagrolaimus sp. ES5 TaxID=591445 RepID=A0AC34GGE9_9BILA